MWQRLILFLTPFDGRYEDLKKGDLRLNILRDFTAGLIVAMVAIPLAMGFAIASGLNPVHGIVGGAVAGLLGALFGGSKYQVYGPTAAFIPVIAGIMEKYGGDPSTYHLGYGFLILVSIIAGVVLMMMGLGGLGALVARVPHSIVVGFTIGIAVTIMMSTIGEVLGIKAKLGTSFLEKLHGIWTHAGEMNAIAIAIGIGTYFVIKYLLKMSIYIPAPLVALATATGISMYLVPGAGLVQVKDKYGAIPTDLLKFTPPVVPPLTSEVIYDIAYFSIAIIFVAAVESLLCSRMADRLADNQGIPYNPNKELWGQGIVNIFVPLSNGFPHTGALARTATNIKVGAVSPLAGIFKCFLKLGIAVYLASYLELVPMACIGGVLLYVAMNMVKPAEVQEVLKDNRFEVATMAYTAVAVIFTDFLTGVLSAMILYAILYRFLAKPTPRADEADKTSEKSEAAA